MAIKVVIDSTSYIPNEYIDKYDIKIISLNVVMDGVSRREVDIDNKYFYEEMSKVDEIPKSSQPIPEEMLSAFEKIVKDGDSIVGIFLSSKMSGTYSNANMVKNMIIEDYPKADIRIIDSKTNCMQMGFAAIKAGEIASEGKSIDEVEDVASQVLDNGRFLFTPETLEYLKKGGRIGGAVALFGNLLQIKPILTVVDGETSVFKKVRTRKKAVDEIVETVLNDIESKGLGDVVVHHINCEEEGLKLANALENKLGKKVGIQSIGPVIGLHVGPGSIGIAYYTK
ncbi:DegV family protein [Terrisporobacter mayombei]|uniref:Protein DegV n=1 Tax=Terrisporobacter mayombei TaxID=1541 RepID=A0ABY9Q0N7_9FIRM|nr:DegV family protein [Terrisporobacter mayombei]MCC3866932.1 DegV family protein [Terrisporobacter mayombei]WMT81179.1 Protein DegV [Terrisporobacter mayombei]